MIPNVNQNLQLMTWTIDSFNYECENSFWFEEFSRSVSVEYAPIIGWENSRGEMAIEAGFKADWGPVSFCSVPRASYIIDKASGCAILVFRTAIVDKGSGAIFVRNDDGYSLFGFDLRAFCEEMAELYHDRKLSVV